MQAGEDMAIPKQRKSETMNVSESRRQYSDILNRVYRDQEQIIIEKNGIPVAAIVPMSTVRDAEITEQNRAAALEALHMVREAFADIPEDELEHELELAMKEAKAIQIQKRARAGDSDSDR
jgi:prevent-host-death family protein